MAPTAAKRVARRTTTYADFIFVSRGEFTPTLTLDQLPFILLTYLFFYWNWQTTLNTHLYKKKYCIIVRQTFICSTRMCNLDTVYWHLDNLGKKHVHDMVSCKVVLVRTEKNAYERFSLTKEKCHIFLNKGVNPGEIYQINLSVTIIGPSHHFGRYFHVCNAFKFFSLTRRLIHMQNIASPVVGYSFFTFRTHNRWIIVELIT